MSKIWGKAEILLNHQILTWLHDLRNILGLKAEYSMRLSLTNLLQSNYGFITSKK